MKKLVSVEIRMNQNMPILGSMVLKIRGVLLVYKKLVLLVVREINALFMNYQFLSIILLYNV